VPVELLLQGLSGDIESVSCAVVEVIKEHTLLVTTSTGTFPTNTVRASLCLGVSSDGTNFAFPDLLLALLPSATDSCTSWDGSPSSSESESKPLGDLSEGLPGATSSSSELVSFSPSCCVSFWVVGFGTSVFRTEYFACFLLAVNKLDILQ
jgi:hypothetical protein